MFFLRTQTRNWHGNTLSTVFKQRKPTNCKNWLAVKFVSHRGKAKLLAFNIIMHARLIESSRRPLFGCKGEILIEAGVCRNQDRLTRSCVGVLVYKLRLISCQDQVSSIALGLASVCIFATKFNSFRSLKYWETPWTLQYELNALPLYSDCSNNQMELLYHAQLLYARNVSLFNLKSQ